MTEREASMVRSASRTRTWISSRATVLFHQAGAGLVHLAFESGEAFGEGGALGFVEPE